MFGGEQRARLVRMTMLMRYFVYPSYGEQRARFVRMTYIDEILCLSFLWRAACEVRQDDGVWWRATCKVRQDDDILNFIKTLRLSEESSCCYS